MTGAPAPNPGRGGRGGAGGRWGRSAAALRDARGRRVGTVAARFTDPDLLREDPELARLLGALAAAQVTGFRDPVRPKDLLFVAMGVLPPLAWILSNALLGGALPAWVLAVASGCGFVFLWRWAVLRIGADTVRNVRRTLLFHSFCPACGYRLAEVPRGADGLIECPECGAAWEPGEVGRRPVDAAPLPPTGAGAARARSACAVQDARNRTVFLTDCRLLLRGETPGPEPARLRHAAGTIRPALLRCRVGTVALAVLCAGSMAFFVFGGNTLIAGVPAALRPVLKVAILVGVLVGAPWVFLVIVRASWWGSGKSFGAAATRALLAESICPSCAADLSTQARDADGVVECPACRAAWRPPPGAPGSGSGPGPEGPRPPAT